jgi:integrase
MEAYRTLSTEAGIMTKNTNRGKRGQLLPVVVTPTAGPLAVAAATDRADHYARASRAPNTWRAYRGAYARFAAWCEHTQAEPMPTAPAVLRAYVASLADAGAALSTINAAVAAIASAHSIAGQPFDRSCIKDDLKGIRRETARAKRKARPLVATDLQAILLSFGQGSRSARDRLLFALGFAGALRRSELIGLDWQIRESGTGFIVQDDRGLVITLLSSKTGKGEPEQIIIPCSDMPTACDALTNWIGRTSAQAGTPLFRSVNKGGEISPDRLSDRSVARIIKKEVRACAIAAGRSEVEAAELAELCSGHSLRAGYCTASAIAGIPEWKARRRSRHRSAETFAGYVRAAEEWTDSGLKGVGF